MKTKQRASKRSGNYREIVVMQKKDRNWMTMLRGEHERLFWGGIATINVVNPLAKGARVIASEVPPRQQTKNTLRWQHVHSQNDRKRRYLPIE